MLTQRLKDAWPAAWPKLQLDALPDLRPSKKQIQVAGAVAIGATGVGLGALLWMRAARKKRQAATAAANHKIKVCVCVVDLVVVRLCTLPLGRGPRALAEQATAPTPSTRACAPTNPHTTHKKQQN